MDPEQLTFVPQMPFLEAQLDLHQGLLQNWEHSVNLCDQCRGGHTLLVIAPSASEDNRRLVSIGGEDRGGL